MTTRRTAVKLIAGAGVGVMFTPAPWKLVRDTALLTQDWPGIPHPLRGEIKEKPAICTLCPSGCALKVKCVGDQPIAVAGAAGGLCAIGVTAHQLPYWPDRVRDGSVQDARAAVAKVGPNDRVAVLDLRPGRTASAMYRKTMAALPNGLYLTPRQPEVAINLAAAKTVISMGAPVLDGWIAPAAAFAARDRFSLVQVERELSRTATMADEWQLEGDAAKLARQKEGPVLVVDRAMSAAVLELNKELGGFGKTVMALPPTAGAALKDVPNGAIRLLYIDETQPGAYIPWPEIEPKLAKDAVTIAFSWSKEGYARHATFTLPAAVFPEATSLMKAPDWTVDPVEFVAGAKAEEVPAAPLPEGFHRINPAMAWLGPMSSKLSQESDLLLAPRQVAVHPSTGLAERSQAFLQTARGRVAVQVVHDATVPPGGARYLPTPDILDISVVDLPKVVTA